MNNQSTNKDNDKLVEFLNEMINSHLELCYFYLVKKADVKDTFQELAVSLLRKFSTQFFTLLHISKGISIDNPATKVNSIIYDKDSIFSISRILFENYFTFHAIYIFLKQKMKGYLDLMFILIVI